MPPGQRTRLWRRCGWRAHFDEGLSQGVVNTWDGIAVKRLGSARMSNTVQQKVCPVCKTLANLNAAFCASCGHKYRTQFTAAQPQVTHTPQDPPNLHGSVVVTCICYLLMVIFGFAGFYAGRSVGVPVLVMFATPGIVFHLGGYLRGRRYEKATGVTPPGLNGLRYTVILAVFCWLAVGIGIAVLRASWSYLPQ